MTLQTSRSNCLYLLSRCQLIILSFLLLSSFPVIGAASTPAQEGVEKISLQRGSQIITLLNIETVSRQAELRKGLAGRTRILDDFGMLFILDSTREQFFWMKGMKFPLDILFFDREKKLTAILKNLTPCEECTKYRAPAHTAYALEINGGVADILGVKEGDRIVFSDK